MSTSLSLLYNIEDISMNVGGYHVYIGGYHVYIGGYSVHQRNTMSTLGDVQYIRGNIMMHLGE